MFTSHSLPQPDLSTRNGETDEEKEL